MELADAFLLAFRALGRNKMRSILTMLGMIIGVGAVIAVIGIGQGAAAKAQEQLAAERSARETAEIAAQEARQQLAKEQKEVAERALKEAHGSVAR